MNVLVIGGTRFLGHEVAWRLLFAGHRVTLLNRGRETDAFGSRVERLRGDRTTADFARLLDGRGKRDEARVVLAPIYAWFTEGSDTKDLREARALLDSLT